VFVAYCVVPNYTWFFIVALAFSFKKNQTKQKYPLQNANQSLSIQVFHNSKKRPCCSCAVLMVNTGYTISLLYVPTATCQLFLVRGIAEPLTLAMGFQQLLLHQIPSRH